jgi:hypothetical protein
MTTTNFTNFTAGPDSVAAEDFVNEAVNAGKTVTVNGVQVVKGYGAPARSWANGSFSWDSQARTTRGTRQNWATKGTNVRVNVEG